MTERLVEEQIRALAENLEPVRPIPPLRVATGGVIALGLLAWAAEWLAGGPGLRPGIGTWPGLPHLVTLVALAVVALAAIGAALAAAIPGREASARLLGRAAAIGLLFALAPGLWIIAVGDTPVVAGMLVGCIGRALSLSVVPVLFACGFIVYAAVRRPGIGTALSLIGGVALGAAAVHATCASDNPLHWIFAHNLAPIAVASLLILPITALISRWTRRV